MFLIDKGPALYIDDLMCVYRVNNSNSFGGQLYNYNKSIKLVEEMNTFFDLYNNYTNFKYTSYIKFRRAKMARGRSNFKMGTVEMIVLFLLQKQDLYGYQLTTLIKKQSNGNVIVTESTLYPTLYKLLKNGYISDREMPIGKRRIRVYYHLEDAGKDRLADLLEDYNEITVGIERILTSDLSFMEEEDESRD